MSTTTRPDDASKQDRTKRAVARSRVYLALALGFRYPTPETVAALHEELDALRSSHEGLDAPTLQSLSAVDQAAKGLSFEEFETESLFVFTHVTSTDCNPSETAYTATHLFQQAQKLANLNGFYRAHGVEPGKERADHISVELEFMAFLAQKEAYAAFRGRTRRLAAARDTQREFLERHLGVWIRTFALFVVAKAGEGVFGALAGLAREFAGAEFSELGASVKEVTGPPKMLPLLMQKEEEDESDDCPEFATAEYLSYMKGVLGAGVGATGEGV